MTHEDRIIIDKAINIYLTGLKGHPESFISEPASEYNLPF